MFLAAVVCEGGQGGGQRLRRPRRPLRPPRAQPRARRRQPRWGGVGELQGQQHPTSRTPSPNPVDSGVVLHHQLPD
jgi:hypothetical protein